MTAPSIDAAKPLGVPSEAWLADGATPEQVGYACGILCQGYTPTCFHGGYCQHDGDCFRSDRRARREAARAIKDAAADKSPAVREVMAWAAKTVLLWDGRSS